MTLYAELMGKYSNAVLVKDGVIVGALKTSVSKSLPVCVILEILPPVSRESSSFAIYLIVNASCGIIIPLIKRSAQIKNIIETGL